MKKILTIICIMMISLSYAQDREQKFALYTFTEPGAYSDGFNIGVGCEYQMNYIYLGGQVFTFPDLNNVTYNHFVGTIGFNIHSKWNEYRVFTGFRPGFIFGKRTGHVLGFEAGIDFNIPNSSMYIGGNVSSDNRGDGAFYEDYIPQSSKNHWVNNVQARIGFKF